MRYRYSKPEIYSAIYGETYICNHPVYNACTLFKINDKGLAVIQQRYDPIAKSTYWSAIDPWLDDELYLHEKFESFFNERAGDIIGAEVAWFKHNAKKFENLLTEGSDKKEETRK